MGGFQLILIKTGGLFKEPIQFDSKRSGLTDKELSEYVGASFKQIKEEGK